jgi:fibronectin type 3 domain-containing protein
MQENHPLTDQGAPLSIVSHHREGKEEKELQWGLDMRRTITLTVVLMMCLAATVQGSEIGPTAQKDITDIVERGPPQTDMRSRGQDLLSDVGGRFTENLGQYGDGTGLYYSMGDPLSIAIGTGWVSYYHRSTEDEKGVMVRVNFGDAYPVTPIGRETLSYPTNFLIGNDPDEWVVGARSYGEVIFEGLYEGIDLVYRFEDGMLKYDFLVEPYADISQIRMVYEGHETLSINEATGDLVIGTAVVEIVDMAPISFQVGRNATEDIRSTYVLLDESEVSFEVEGCDPGLPLVMDPGFIFSTAIGGNGAEAAYLLVDDVGDVYLYGATYSSDFPTTPGVIIEDYSFSQDGFICKLKGDGSDLLFSTYIGTNGFDVCIDLILDDEKNIIVTGFTEGSTFPVTYGTFQTELAGSLDAFVTKLNVNCSKVLWSTFYGGGGSDAGFFLERMTNGDIMVVGTTSSADLPMAIGGYDTSPNGDVDLFAARFNNNGTELLRSTYVGGAGEDLPTFYNNGLVVDDNEDVYICSHTWSADFPVSPNAFSKNWSGRVDTAIIKLDGDLTQMIFSTYIGGSSRDAPTAIAVDETGCVYVAGITISPDFPTTSNALDPSFNSPGVSDGFLTKLSADGSALEFSTYFGGRADDEVTDIQLDADGHVYLSVITSSSTLPVTEHAINTKFAGEFDIYLGVLDGVNHTLRFGSYIGATGCEGPRASILIHNVSLTLASHTQSLDYPTTPGAYDKVRDSHSGDIVVSRFNVTLSDPVPSDPPGNLTAMLGNTSIRLDWEPPVDTGSFARWGYWLYVGTSVGDLHRLTELSPDSTDYTHLSPSAGLTYFYSVTAFSAAGESYGSNMVNVTFITAPAPPTGLSAVAGCGTIRLNWSFPEHSGGLPLEGYSIHRGTAQDGLQPFAVLEDVTEYLDEDVVNGVTYHYRVTSFNGIGNSTFTPLVTATPLGPPTAVLELIAKPGDRIVTLQWAPPELDGGRSILGYDVLRGSDPSSLEPLGSVGVSMNEYDDRVPKNGVTYFYAVQAYNSIGVGPMGQIIPVVPTGPPGTPHKFSLAPGDGHVVLSWELPVEDGGSPINSFIIYKGISEAHLSHLVQVAGSKTTFTDEGLLNGKTLWYAVQATNQFGEGPRTAALEVIPLGLPDAPNALTAEADIGIIVITWSRPIQDGGSEVTHYVIYRGTSLDDLEPLNTFRTDELSFEDTEIDAGTTYYYAVAAVTTAGEGPSSLPASARSFGPPGAPLGLVASASNSEVALFWETPDDDGGSSITGYGIMRGTPTSGLQELVQLGVVTSYLDTTVVNDLTYDYVIAAINEAGTGTYTEIIKATPERPKGPPTVVTALMAEVIGAEVVLNWAAPNDDGGSPITGYIVLRGLSADALEQLDEVGPDVTSYTDEGVKRGTTYYYSIAAKNLVGDGEPITAKEVKVPKKAEEPGFEVLSATLALLIVLPISFWRRRFH